MKILIATGIYPPDIGGPATYSKILKDELSKHGIGVEILSFGEVRHLPKIIRHFVYFLKCLRRGSRADLIFAQDPVSVGLPSVLAAKILRKKFALKIVGDYAWEQYQNKIFNFQFRTSSLRTKAIFNFVDLDKFQTQRFDFLTELRRKIQKFVARKADKIIVPSEYLKRIITKGWSVPEGKIKVIYNCVSGMDNVISHSDSADKRYLLSIGRLVPWKGFDVLIEAMAELPQEFKLIIIGGGPEKERLENGVKKLKLENRVKLTGTISKEKVYDYFLRAKVFALNTGYEGLPHVILEAMACGVPIITTNIGGNPELIENGCNGILVEYNNKEQIKEAILRLWNDAELREKFVENSYKMLDKFSLANMIERTIEVLKM